MAEKDRLKWDKKYRQKPTLLKTRPPSPLLVKHLSSLNGACAIDLACGSGRHTLYLLEHGFCVDAVDISSVALQTLASKTKGKEVTLLREDLDTFTPQMHRYDLAVMSNYLDRALIRRTIATLKPGALFFIETYMDHPENEKKDSNPDFLLAPNELPGFFDDGFEILAYGEYPNESYELYRMYKQGIIAKKHV
ncbi:Putative SAM-dependent methyltransferase Bucepa02006346 [hydrothermal vent metagenome]|uniref:Putative SAM-dependent methyltransferase Bucepa02006346 n=1 Tax=hydrothermal vent metagenome TaxID=652676 RepID=A0A1W1EB21_9ZZZZ